MFCRNKKVIRLEDILIIFCGLNLEEGVFELRNLNIRFKFLFLLYIIFIVS